MLEKIAFKFKQIKFHKMLCKTFCNNNITSEDPNVDIEANKKTLLPANKKIWKYSNSHSIQKSIINKVGEKNVLLEAKTAFAENLKTFAYKNNINYNQATKSKGDNLFLHADIKLVHYLDDRNINDYKQGVKESNYEFYDVYRDIPEFLFLGRSNVGKSSLINSLFGKKVTLENKRPGKTQRLEFYIFGRTGRSGKKTLTSKSIYSKLKPENMVPNGFLIDAPGFGWVDGPVILKRKFKYLIYSYLNYAVRLNLIVYLINGEYGITSIDEEEITFLNNFNKTIQLVFTKVDKFSDSKVIQYLSEASHFTRDLKNVRTEILLTSTKTGYGVCNLRSHLFMDIKEIEDCKKASGEDHKLLPDANTHIISNIPDVKI